MATAVKGQSAPKGQGNQGRGNPVQDYITVSERIETFYRKHNEGRIVTHIVEHDQERGFILMCAEVYRNVDDAMPSATGHAYELKSEGYVQRTSYIEVCETSSVGRALALCGFEVKRGIASREEIEKAERCEETGKQTAPAHTNGAIATTMSDLATESQKKAIRALASAKAIDVEVECWTINKCKVDELHQQAAEEFAKHLTNLKAASPGVAPRPTGPIPSREESAKKITPLLKELTAAGHADFQDAESRTRYLRKVAQKRWSIQINPDEIESSADLPDDLLAELPAILEAELKEFNQQKPKDDFVC